MTTEVEIKNLGVKHVQVQRVRKDNNMADCATVLQPGFSVIYTVWHGTTVEIKEVEITEAAQQNYAVMGPKG